MGTIKVGSIGLEEQGKIRGNLERETLNSCRTVGCLSEALSSKINHRRKKEKKKMERDDLLLSAQIIHVA